MRETSINPINDQVAEQPEVKDTHKAISMEEYLLWKSFKEGDMGAYAAIYKRYFFTLYHYGKKICDDHELIKDNIQDLFIKIWNNRANLTDTSSVKYYLFTSLKRKLLDTLQSPGIRMASESEGLDYELGIAVEEEDDSVHLEEKEKVLQALNRLSEHQQKLLRLKFYKNLSNQEIAQEMGITIQSVYNAVFKALKTLRKQLTVITLLGLSQLCAYFLLD